MTHILDFESWVRDDRAPHEADALALADCTDLDRLSAQARLWRDQYHGANISYSRKVFIPLTHLCRDVCHYCTFATPPRKGEAAYMSPAEVLAVARAGAEAGCKEALFTLGDKPEERYGVARQQLSELGHETTLSYLREMADLVFQETGLLPHLNPGVMTAKDLASLREVSVSQGIMLESTSTRLLQRGGCHFGSPDKDPKLRLDCIAEAGRQHIPFTTGILIGIGETRRERIEALLELRALHLEYGHIQEIIVQNFRAKADTKMKNWPEPDLADLQWTIAVTRLIFGGAMNIQAPPNLSGDDAPALIDAGINDWGGVSPVTPDFVNPEAPWPQLDRLAAMTARAGKHLVERLAIYPGHAMAGEVWLDPAFRPAVLQAQDSEGLARSHDWSPGGDSQLPLREITAIAPHHTLPSPELREILASAAEGADLSEQQITRLFHARGGEAARVIAAADELRQKVNGDVVSYIVTRNINYTNVCYFKCQFCAFSKGKMSENLRGRPYNLDHEEIARRVAEAWDRGATEVCMQGGIHPEYTGQTYLDICRLVKETAPGMHVHAFSPLEVYQGAQTLGVDLTDFLTQLRDAGLGSLPGTAAEVLDDEVRAILCPDKINTEIWLEVMATAHQVGLRTTSTIMFGHVDRPRHWARHLLHLRNLQKRTGGFTELVPLPFVHMEAPIYLKGRARRGPSFREAILIHAVARLALYPHIDNIQTSWVKLGLEGTEICLNGGANDLGGTLMNETITRAAGATHGQEMSPEMLENAILRAGRVPRMRTTLYEDAPAERRATAFAAAPVTDVINTPAVKYERDRNADGGARKPALIRGGVSAGN